MELNQFAIETKGLHYAFRQKTPVVNQLSLQVPTGSIYGFLGPNGAGKTTTMRLLTGMLPNPTDNIYLFGKSLQQHIPQVFESVGTLIEMPSLYLHLSATDNLRIICKLRGITEANIGKTLSIVGLSQVAKRKVKEFSLGMKQRLGIAMALLPEPKLLMLDEPVNGLDPAGIIEMRKLLLQLNQEQGLTIFISSHLLNEVEKTCNHVGIIHKGVLQFQGSLNDLYENSQQQGVEVVFKIPELTNYFAQIESQYPKAQQLNATLLQLQLPSELAIASTNEWMAQQHIPVTGIQSKQGLEEWFMNITKN